MMADNRALWRSLHFLARPFSLAALLLLMVNDSLLKHFWPSVFTGKLSDLAWMFLAPVVVTAGLAWLAPRGLRRHERIVAGIGFGMTAAGFALFKTLPVMRAAVLDVWQAGLGFPAAAVLDPTDLAALLSVVCTAWLWRRQNPLGTALPLRAVFVIPLLAILTLADAAAPDYGIACLDNQDGQIMAYSAYSAYSSKDGGLTWNEGGFSVQLCSLAEPAMTELTLEPAGLHFRFQPGQNIESSTDGRHWELAYALAPLTEADEAYYQKVHSGNPAMHATPLAAIADPQHRSVIFAMGHEGVLVRQSSGEWTWAALGSYRKIEAASVWSFITTVLSGEIVLAVALILLIISFGAFIRRRHWIWSGLIWAGWIGWALMPMLFTPALSTQYMASVSIIGGYGIAALALLMSVLGGVRLARVSALTFWKLIAVAFAGGLIYFLPYGLWTYNLLTQYYIAESLAIVLGAGMGITGVMLVRNQQKKLYKNDPNGS